MARILKEYPAVVLKEEDINEKVDFKALFGRSQEVHIEIGAGKGTFIVNQARTFPEIDFLGIEWARKYYRHAVDRIGRWQLKNARMIRTEAADFIAKNLKNSSVDWFHVYFPDPWPKKRHNKRRFLCKDNLTEMLRCLKTGGVIQIATDHKDYYEQITTVFNDGDDRFEKIGFIKAANAQQAECVGTNFERKYIKDQRAVYTLAVRKLPTDTNPN